jgi:hypothetical protein
MFKYIIPFIFLLILSFAFSPFAYPKDEKILGQNLNAQEERKTKGQVLLVGNFKEQIEFFYRHYGRVPTSYEEWRDSGFLLFTPWSGNPTEPAKHVDYTPSAEQEPYGTFHYECLGPQEYKLELVIDVSGPIKVLDFSKNFDDLIFPTKTGYSYMEAKADILLALADLLHVYYVDCKPAGLLTEYKPEGLMEIIDGYISLVPEGFSIPVGVDFEGFFEFGFDLTTGQRYALNNLGQSWFKLMIEGFGEGLESQLNRIKGHDKLVLFSSELLKAGFPGLFERQEVIGEY